MQTVRLEIGAWRFVHQVIDKESCRMMLGGEKGRFSAALPPVFHEVS